MTAMTAAAPFDRMSTFAGLGALEPGAARATAAAFDVHLQWFAAEDEGRTEEPSEHKIRKAREEGKVARSGEVSSSLVLLAGIAALGLLGEYILRSCVQMYAFFISRAASPEALSPGLVLAVMGWLAKIARPVLVVVFVVAVPCFALSVLIEGNCLQRRAKNVSARTFWSAVIKANSYSYLLLLFLDCVWLRAKLW